MRHDQPQRRSWLRAACAVAVVCATASVGATGGHAKVSVACPNSVGTPYSMQLKALAGPGGADLKVTVAVDPASQCALPDALETIQLKTFDTAERFAWVRSIENVPAPGGVADLDLGLIPHNRRIDAEVTLSTGGTFVLHGTTKTLTRPDLVVQQITPTQALVGTSFSVNAVIIERNGDVGATADVTLSAIPGAVEHVVVPAGGTATVSFSVMFGSAVPVEVSDGDRDRRHADGDRRDEQRFDPDGRHHAEPAREPVPRALPVAARLRRTVQRAPLCADHDPIHAAG